MPLASTGCTVLRGEMTCGKLFSMIRNVLVNKEEKDVTSGQVDYLTSRSTIKAVTQGKM